MVKIISNHGSVDIDDSEPNSSGHHEFIGAIDESTDEDGSIAYVEDYETTENGEEEGAFFVEYVNEGDENLITADENDDESDANQLSEYADGDDDLYNCNLCGMNFKSITDHIEKYHSGQDVLIDISEESGTTIKAEHKLTDPLEYDEINDDENADNTIANDGEMIVYGDETLENEQELLDGLTDEDDQSEVYTYDGATGSLTKATSAKAVKRTRAATDKIDVCIFFILFFSFLL